MTDDKFGLSFPRARCNECDFEFCYELPAGILDAYVKMSDEIFLETSLGRSVQAKKLVEFVINSSKEIGIQSTWLDVGAASGLLVAEAKKFGFKTQGVEPSLQLVKSALENGVVLTQGTITEVTEMFDVISCIDVIEHVEDPVSMISEIWAKLNENGLLLIVTPDKSSFVARVLGDRWWHIRPAHIGYFNSRNLTDLLGLKGFVKLKTSRPTWYLPINYILVRILKFIGLGTLSKFLNETRGMNVPVNLRDSVLILAQKVNR